MESKLCREQKNRKKERKRKPQEYESQVFATLKKERKYRIPTAEKICWQMKTKHKSKKLQKNGKTYVKTAKKI